VVADKGYHSDETVLAIAQAEARSYIPEPKRPLRNWTVRRMNESSVCQSPASQRQPWQALAEEAR
jgi:hypothetical protein